MNIETKFFGMQSVDEKEIVSFTHGIPGFEEFHRYVILQYKEESPFLIMQSLEDSELALILVQLERVMPGYSFDLENDVVSDLKLADPEDAVLFAVVVIPQDVSKSTVNLAAPIIINNQAKLGQQIIVNNPDYSMRHPLLFPESKPAEPQTVEVK